MQEFIIIGYSGHAYVICNAIISNGNSPKNYIDFEKKEFNPYV